MAKTRVLVEFGMGTSLRREDYTEAALRAIKDALWHNSVNMAELFGFPKEAMIIDAEIGDILVMDGSGAYCSGMSTKNYNSFPEAPEVLVDREGKVHLIRQRQSLEQIYQNEVTPKGAF